MLLRERAPRNDFSVPVKLHYFSSHVKPLMWLSLVKTSEIEVLSELCSLSSLCAIYRVPKVYE